jgi:hypothetical protein
MLFSHLRLWQPNSKIKIQQSATMYQHLYYSIFIWSSTCFGRDTAHHQEPKIALAASGFSYVESFRHSVPDNVHQPHVQTTFHIWNTKGCQCSIRFPMMGGVSPETCWASYKYGIIKCWYIVASCWIFLYELYCDARTHERQVYQTVSYLHVFWYKSLINLLSSTCQFHALLFFFSFLWKWKVCCYH